MPTAMIHPPQLAAHVPSITSPSQAPQTLRRATYIHISDLTSAYNIDHSRLEEELMRVSKDKEQEKASIESTKEGFPTEFDTNQQQRRLQPPRIGYNLCVLVGSVRIVVDKKRVDGSRVRLAEVEVGDETGVVSLRARDEQIDLIQKVSERQGTVVLRNCTIELFQGKHIRLAITKWGKISIYPDSIASTPPPPSKINRERNFSLIDLSVVASEMVAEPFYHHHVQHQQSSPESDGQSPGSSQFEVGNRQNRQFNNTSKRRPPTYTKIGAGMPAVPGLPAHHSQYQEQQRLQQKGQSYHGEGMLRYIDVSPYQYGQQDTMPSPQQLMYQQQQQYQMHQQRQLHHMYHMQQHGEQRLHHPPSSPMMSSPRVGPATSFESFGTLASSSEIHTPVGRSFVLPVSSVSPHHNVVSTPPSPRMNPQAPSFDPNQK